MGSPSRNVQYHPPRLSEDRLNLPQPHSPSLPYTLLREIGNAPGRTVGLFAATPFDFGGSHRHAGTVHPKVHRGRRRRCGLAAGALVGGDLAAEHLGTAFDLPGLDSYPGQDRQQLARLGEADLGRRQSHHPRGGW